MTIAKPKKILLATDLSARCDRALDRAVALAEAWGADLTAVHAFEDGEDVERLVGRRQPSWRQASEASAIAETQLRRDLSGRHVTAVVEKGDPADVILQAAETRGADLIVTGLARNEALGRLSLGATVNKLIRRSRVPVLIVKERPLRPYSEILVASDFSTSSREALTVATGLFPDTVLNLFHAYDAPMAGMTQDPAAYREGFRSRVMEDAEKFLTDAGITGERRRRLSLLVEPGDPVELIHQYVEERGVDLIVVGTRGRSAVLDVLIGSTAKAILASLPCDALVVREARPA